MPPFLNKAHPILLERQADGIFENDRILRDAAAEQKTKEAEIADRKRWADEEERNFSLLLDAVINEKSKKLRKDENADELEDVKPASPR